MIQLQNDCYTLYRKFLIQNLQTMRKSQAVQLFKKLRQDSKQRPVQPQPPIDPDAVQRQQILFKTYLIEKRGRTFGSSQYRKFFIRDGRLFQQSDKQKKVLPLPIAVTLEIKFKGRKWNDLCNDLPIRLYLEFVGRNPIYIYFNNIRESQEIRTYILALKMKEAGRCLSGNAINFKDAVVEAFRQKLLNKGGNLQSILVRDQKRIAVQNLLAATTKADMTNSLIEMWQKKTEKLQKATKLVIFSFRVKSFRALHVNDLKLIAPTLRVILGGKIAFESRPNPTKQGDILVYYNRDTSFRQPPQCTLKEELVLEISDGRAKWRSERMQLFDLWKHNQRIICIPLQSSQPYPAIIFEYLFSPSNPEKPISYLPVCFSPENYFVLNEIIGGQENQNPTTLHQGYVGAVEDYLKKRQQETIFYWLKKYTEILEIEQLINKGFESEPFKSLPQVKQHRGTVIYRHFVILSREFRYYDVERIIWKFGNPHLRRFYNAIKCFDAEPARINFTQKIYYLLMKVFEIVESTSELFWNDTLFERSTIGKQSAAFFVSLVLLRKIAPNYWSVGARQRGLSNNSLLFHYIWKNCWKNGESYKSLYKKFTRLEINIEALFGVYSVSLLAELFSGQTYFRILVALIGEANTMKSIYNFVLIGLFLSLLDRVGKYESAFESPGNFILALELIARNIHNSYEFLRDGDLHIDFVKKEVCMPRFLEIKQSMDSYYLENMVQERPSDIIPAMYSAFSHYHYKDQNAERVLHICIDKIQLNIECPKLSLFILQNNQIISESQFSSAPLRQLNYVINLKLQSLSDLVIGVLEDPTAQALFCRINPRTLPSNFSFQLTLPLQKQQGSLFLDEPCSFISLQLMIKQPKLGSRPGFKADHPQKYVDYFLDTPQIKADLAVLQKYVDMLCIAQNNYNVMYGQLGWWGNYYVVPDERLLEIYEVGSQSLQVPPDRQNFYRVARYGRQVYGKAMVCSHGKKYFMRYTKNEIECCSIHRPQSPETLKNSFIANSLLCTYALETVASDNSCYMDFFLRVMDLPLISYLTYDPEKLISQRDISFELNLGTQKSTIILTSIGDEFVLFSEAQAIEIENNITFRILKLRPKHLFKFPCMIGPVDNFLYYLRLNILRQIINIEQPDPKVLSKWPNRLVFSSSQLSQPMKNISLQKLLLLASETDYHLSLQFAELGKPRLKHFRSWAFLKYYHRWRPVEVLCSISSVFRHYFVQEDVTRRRFIVKESHVVLSEEVKVKLSCETDEIKDGRSALYKKLDKMF